MNLLPIELVTLAGDQLVTDSLRVARHFGKQHKNVLQAIERLDCSAGFRRLNFQPAQYTDGQGKSRPCVYLTKDGFMFLAMGFVGPEAARIKEAYINAFNTMASQLERRDLGLMRRLLDHELRDKDSKQRGQIAGRLLVKRRTEKRRLASEERELRAIAQAPLFQLVKGGA